MTSSLPRPALVTGQSGLEIVCSIPPKSTIPPKSPPLSEIFGVVFGTVLGVGLVVVLVAGLSIALFSDAVKNMGIYLFRRGLKKVFLSPFYLLQNNILGR